MNHILLLAWRHFASRPARTATSVLGVGLGLATVLAVLTIDHNTILTQLRRSSVPPVARPDVEIRPLRPNPPDLAALRRQLAARTDLQSVAALFFGAVDVAGGRGGAARQDVRLCALEPGAGHAFESYEIAAGEDLEDGADLLVSQSIARELQLQLGDELEVTRATPRVQGCVDGEIITIGEPAPPVDKRTFRVSGILAPLNLGTQPVVVIGFDAAMPLFAGAHVLPLFWG